MHPSNNHSEIIEKKQTQTNRAYLQYEPFLPTRMLNQHVSLHNRLVYNMPPAKETYPQKNTRMSKTSKKNDLQNVSLLP